MKNKLSTKLSLVSFSSIIIVMMITSLISYFIERNKRINEIKELSKEIINRISYNAILPLWNYDYDQIKSITLLEMNNKNISSITILNEMGNLIINLERNKNNIIQNNNINFDNKKKYFLSFSNDISNNNKLIGKLQVNFTDKYLKKELRDLLISSLIQTIFICSILFVAIFISMKYMIIDKLEILIKSLDLFKNKRFNERINLTSDDEIGEVVNSFNEMAKTIEESFYTIESQNAQIKAYNENLENLVRERTEKLRIANELMKKELKMAQKIQESLIPKVFPFSELIDMNGIYLPMEELGGDYYDVFKISNSKLGIVIADVSGHGVPSALITTMAKVSFSNNSKPGMTSAEIVGNVNKELFDLIGDIESYLTAFYCIIDIESGTLQYTSAGHQDVLILRKDMIIKLPSTSVFIGSFQDFEYTYKEVKLMNNDKIIFYTDGIPELRNSKNEFYTNNRLENLLIQNHKLSVKDLIKTIVNDIDNFKGDEPPHDDITLLIAEMKFNNNIILFDVDRRIEYEEMHNKILEKSGDTEKYIELNEKYVKALKLYKDEKYNEAFAIIKDLSDEFTRRNDKFKILELCGHIQYKMNNYKDAKLFWLEAKNYSSNNSEILRNLEIIERLI